MNTATMTIGNPKTGAARPRRSLEEFVDRLMATLTFTAEPDPVAVVGPHHDLATQSSGRLEELVDRLMATLTFGVEPEPAPVEASSGLVRDIHQSRRLRQEGNLDGALQTLAGAAPVSAAPPKDALGLHRVETSLSAGGSATWAHWSTARKQAGPPPWCPRVLAEPLRWSPCWACPGGRASLCLGVACGACVPQCQARDRLRGGLALDPGPVTHSGDAGGATDLTTPGGTQRLLVSHCTGRTHRRVAVPRLPALHTLHHGGACTPYSLFAGPASA